MLPAISRCCGGRDGGEDTAPSSRVQLTPGTRHRLRVAGRGSQGLPELTVGYPPSGEGCSEIGGWNQCRWEWSSASCPTGLLLAVVFPRSWFPGGGGAGWERGQPPKMVPLESLGGGWQGEAGEQAVAGWQLWSPLPADPHAAPPGAPQACRGCPSLWGTAGTRSPGASSVAPGVSSSTGRREAHGPLAHVLTAVLGQVSVDAWPAAHGKPDCPTTHTDTENTPRKALCRRRAGVW